MKRVALLFITLLLSSATVVSQNITVAEMRSWQEDITNENYDVVSRKMETTFHGKINETAPDSIKYYYYVINAAIEGQRNDNTTIEREYCQKALHIREKRLGILDPEYIELLWAIGSGYEETEVDSAVSYYQKAIVIGQTLMKNPQIIEQPRWAFMIKTYGLVLGDLAELYEKKGWINEVVELYNYGHSLCSSPTLGFDVTSYIYKNRLAWFCEKHGNYKMAIDAFEDALSLIKERIGKNNKDYVNELYFKANILCKSGQESEGLSAYKEAIEIASDALEPNDDLWSGLYGNYYLELGKTGDITSMFRISTNARQKIPEKFHISLDYADCLALQKAKKIDESIAFCSECYSRLRKEAREETQLYLDFFNLIVENYRLKNNIDSVFMFCEEEKKYLLQKNISQKTMAYFDACNVLGVQYLKLNKLSEAMLNFKDAERFCSSVFEKENGNHALLYHNIGRCYMLQKDLTHAQTYLTKSKELQVLLYGIPIERTILYLKEVESMLK